MENAQLAERQQRFQERFVALDGELRALDSQKPAARASDASDAWAKWRGAKSRGLELQYEIGELCAKHGKCQLAILYFQRLADELKLSAAAPQGATFTDGATLSDQKEPSELAALRVNVLNCLASLQFRQGDHSRAMALLLDAKQLHREATTAAADGAAGASRVVRSNLMDKPLAVNYALYLHAKGNVQDAVQVARSVIEAPMSADLLPLSGSINQTEGDQANEEANQEAKAVDSAARSTAYMLLATCIRDENERSTEVLELAELAVDEADQSADAEIQCRAHTNLGLFRFERGESTAALSHLVAAFRAAIHCGDLHLQAITKYHFGVVLAHTDAQDAEELSAELQRDGPSLPECESSRPLADDMMIEGDTTVVASIGGERAQPAAVVLSAYEATATPARTPKDWFLQSESLAESLSAPDRRLGVLAHGCLGEEEYHAGEFHTAEAEFTIALKRLRALLDPPADATGASDTGHDELSVTEPLDMVTAREMDPELAKLQGFLLSYLGCTLLVEGRFDLSERAHQSDLALALEREDAFAQQRAQRNLALVFNCTQRFAEAVPMWRDALETAAVLQNKPDQMKALSGLGTALKEYQLRKRASSASTREDEDEDEDASLGASPLPIFLRYRALAVEEGDKYQQILAQRHIVSVYESHTLEAGSPRTEASAGESAVEKRLVECDALVRLCGQHDNLQFRADAYRSLANALTAQVGRLRSRGAARFADAIAVLSKKRDEVCDKYEDATAALALTSAVAFDHREPEDAMELKERPPRAPITRVDVVPRR